MNPEKDVLIRAIDYFNRNMKDHNFEYLMQNAPFDYSVAESWYQDQINEMAFRIVGITVVKEVIAVAHLRIFHGKASHTAKLGVTVDSNYRNKGIAKKICEELFIIGKASGIERVEALPINRNEPAIKLLKSLGFLTEGVASRKYKEGDNHYHDCLYMTKFL